MNSLYRSSVSPHIRARDHITSIMWSVVAALIPALLFSIYHFGLMVLSTIGVCIVTSVATELIILALRKKNLSIAFDGSAVLTGLLLAFNLPPGISWWIAMIGSVVAIAIAKQMFGGLGYNIFNPALVARAFLLAAWPVDMTTWQVQGITGPTPLAIFKEHGMSDLLSQFSSKIDMYWQLFSGNTGGCIGETSELLLLVGALYLLYKKIITWHIPVTFIGSVFVLGWLFAGQDGLAQGDPVFYIFSGGVFLGAFYMATDMVTTPLTRPGKLIFGFGCGLFTFLIRKFGSYPEGVSYAILLMNAVTPIIDRYVTVRKFGMKRGEQIKI